MTASSANFVLSVGQKVGQYTVVNTLASTEYCQIYLVSSERVHKPLVLKLYLESSIHAKQLFELESKLMMELADQSHIAKIMHVGQYQMYDYFVMHYYPSSLHDLLNAHQQQLPFNQSLSVIEALFRTLQVLHDKQILYLDLKPENIYFDTSQHLVLADFNNCLVQKNSPYHAIFGLGTQHIERCSPAYAAPELIEAVAKGTGAVLLQPSTDMFSVGMLWYRMLVGEVANTDDKETFSNELQGLAPEWARNLIQDLLALDSNERPQSASKCAQLIAEQHIRNQQAIFENQTRVVHQDDIPERINLLTKEIDDILLEKGKLSEQEKRRLCILYLPNAEQPSTSDNEDSKVQKLNALDTVIQECKERLSEQNGLSSWFAWTEYVYQYKANSGANISAQRQREMLQIGRSTRPDNPQAADELLKNTLRVSRGLPPKMGRIAKYLMLVIVIFLLLFLYSNDNLPSVSSSTDAIPQYADGLVDARAEPEAIVSQTDDTSQLSEAMQGSLTAKPDQNEDRTMFDESKGAYLITSVKGSSTEIQWAMLPQLPNIKVMRTEVSQEFYSICVEDGFCRNTKTFSTQKNARQPELVLLPKTNISWYAVSEEFIPWLNQKTGKQFDLPTLAQWQQITSLILPDSQGIHCKDCTSVKSRSYANAVMPVKSLLDNASDKTLAHLYGNAQEWLKDCWQDNNSIVQGYKRCDQALVAGGAYNWHYSQIQKNPLDKLLKTASTPTTGFRLVEYTNVK